MSSRPAGARLLGVVLTVIAAAGLTGCAPAAPHALGLHDTSITESLPISIYSSAWYGVPLDNGSDSPITIRTLRLIGGRNVRAGRPFVIAYPPGDYIDWYSPPGTPGMRRAVAARVPLVGFTIPPRTKGRYQAVVLVSARDGRRTASVTGAIVGYDSGSDRFEETWLERSSLRARS